MQLVGLAFDAIGGLGSLVCLILVIVKMFQNGSAGLGIVTILLSFCGVGVLIGFIFGWVKSGPWNIRNLMLVWTGCIVLIVLGNLMAPGAIPVPVGQ
jgi:hypothetical protein